MLLLLSIINNLLLTLWILSDYPYYKLLILLLLILTTWYLLLINHCKGKGLFFFFWPRERFFFWPDHERRDSFGRTPRHKRFFFLWAGAPALTSSPPSSPRLSPRPREREVFFGQFPCRERFFFSRTPCHERVLFFGRTPRHEREVFFWPEPQLSPAVFPALLICSGREIWNLKVCILNLSQIVRLRNKI